MKLERLEITLELLTAESAELVRQWRNQPEILQQMEYRQLITAAGQQQWLAGIDPATDQYFLISFRGEPAGMIHLIHIDHQLHTAEAGLFIGEARFSGTGIALGASLLLLDHAFGSLALTRVRAKVRNTNTAALEYNRFLGFKEERALNETFTLFGLEREVYFSKRELLMNLVCGPGL